MDIGLISDIHGDIDGLEQALALFADKDVMQIICVGDLVNGLAGGDAVVARLRAEGIPCVQGNHDALARQRQAMIYADKRLAPHQLNDATLDFLDALPHQRTFTFAGTGLILFHATPWDLETYIHPKKSADYFHRLADSVGEDIQVIVVGHSHIPMVTHITDRLWIINPGSVYSSMPFEFETDHRNRRCAVLHLPEIACTFYDADNGQTIQPAWVEIP